jgi:regulator of PEP synthase PpsR (kinase-PPPase family)
MNKCTVYIVSDSLSNTAESVARSAAIHFSELNIDFVKYSNIKSSKKVNQIIDKAVLTKPSLIVFSTVIEEIRNSLIMGCLENRIGYLDVLLPILQVFGSTFNIPPVYKAEDSWELDEEYYNRIHAIEFAIRYDDGLKPEAALIADIALIGVSRTSKTPLSIYLAYHNIKAVNIPLIPELPVPEYIFQIPRHKIIGLTIDPYRLNQIREERNLLLGLNISSNYSNLEDIFLELEFAHNIMKKIGCLVIDVTNKAIEDTAGIIFEMVNKQSNSIKK